MNERTRAALGSLVFFLVAPVTVAGLGPAWISGWAWRAPLLGFEAERAVGAALALAGLAMLVDSFVRFALTGLGTPAPVYPTRHLVAGGLFRHVRNPIYVALLALILGQALIFGEARLLPYAALVWLSCHLFVVFYEEPTLRRSFGEEYDTFARNVPRWIPRLTPWDGPGG